MSRSLKKGPFINYKLEKKVIDASETKKKSVIKTWSRGSMISPDFVGQTIAVYNGNKFIPVYVTENMVGHISGWANLPRHGFSEDIQGIKIKVRNKDNLTILWALKVVTKLKSVKRKKRAFSLPG